MKYTLLFLIFLTGCAAQMISAPGDTTEYAPINERTRVGTIRYLNQGADFVIKERRSDAYKKMYNTCSGRYQIVAEAPTQGGLTTAQNLGSGVTIFSGTEYWYISFQCS